MFIRKTLVSVLFAAGTLGIVALTATYATTSEASTPAGISVRIAPPPLRHEIIPVPQRGYVWVPGYWCGVATAMCGWPAAGCASDAAISTNHIAGNSVVTAGISIVAAGTVTETAFRTIATVIPTIRTVRNSAANR